MIAKADKPLTEQQQSFCLHYTNNDSRETHHNATKSVEAAGSKGTPESLRVIGCKYLTEVNIMAEITRIRAEKQVKLTHDHDINLRLLNEQLEHLAPACEIGNIQAIQARTAVLRELNASNGLHSSTIHNENSNADKTPKTAQEQAATDAAVAAYHREMSLKPSIDKELG